MEIAFFLGGGVSGSLNILSTGARRTSVRARRVELKRELNMGCDIVTFLGRVLKRGLNIVRRRYGGMRYGLNVGLKRD